MVLSCFNKRATIYFIVLGQEGNCFVVQRNERDMTPGAPKQAEGRTVHSVRPSLCLREPLIQAALLVVVRLQPCPTVPPFLSNGPSAAGSSRWSRPIPAARLNRAIRLAESGLAPFRQHFTKRMSMQSSRAKARQESPDATLNLSSRWGNSSGNRGGSGR